MGARLFTPRASARIASESGRNRLSLRRGPEIAALLLFAAATYISLALLSLELDPSDPTVVGGDWVGPVGASMAQHLVQGFGIIAWALPLELALIGAPLFQRQDPRVSGLRIAGDVLVAIIAAALTHVALPSATAFGAMRAGGNVGLIFGELFSALFSTAGSFLVGVTVIGLVLIGRASFSFIELYERVVCQCQRATHGLLRIFRRMESAWQRTRLARSEEPTTQPHEAPAENALAPLSEELSHRPGDALLDPVAQAPNEGSLHALSEDSESRANDVHSGADPEVIALSFPTTKLKAKRARKRTAAASQDESSDVDSSTSPATDPGESNETTQTEEKRAKLTIKEATEAKIRAKETSDVALTIVDTRQNSAVEQAKAKTPKRVAVNFDLPTPDILEPASSEVVRVDRERVLELAERLEKTLADYGVTGKVEEVHPGPTVTTYEVAPQAGTKVSKVAGLVDDLALGLSRKVRIIAPIPGKARIGFELPNDERVPVNLRELIEDRRFEKLSEKTDLPVVLGRDIVGAPCYADLAAMPHVIVAGATGAGKSVGLNVMLSSLLFRRSPDELRLLMVDPKVVELAPFDGIPHLLLPVVTDMKQAAKALKWAVDEMEKRYQAFAIAGTKNIGTYNRWVDRVQKGEIKPPQPEEVTALTADGAAVSVPAAQAGTDGAPHPGRMPHIVVVVDEFADLMMQQGKDVEGAVARLAQKARAAGMHVVLATQRPSVDVITGMIKANFPTRVAYRVAQKVDSRTILDEMGAELLLGRGDMLVKLNGSSDTQRVQCPFVSEEEVNRLTDYLRTQGSPVYHDDILAGGDDEDSGNDPDENLDPRFDEAVRIVADTQRCSTSWLQRKMTIGYNRAAKIVESMEARGIVGPPNGSKDREIFVQEQ